jgi:hypothetical protein
MSQQLAPPRYGPLSPQNWPQMDNRVPRAMASQMPHVERLNFERARQESFTVSGTFNLPVSIVVGQQFALLLPTDQDGDFWCDQIAMVGWGPQLNPGAPSFPANPLPGTIDISDIRTGRALTYPLATLPTEFLATVTTFSDDPGFDPGAQPYPAGFRSTSTLAQPFCFTRAGGIQLLLTSGAVWNGAGVNQVDIAFGGWKEYEFASA